MSRRGPDRRAVALGLVAAGAGLMAPSPSRALISALEIVSGTGAGDGDDQLARAIAEGLTSTRLLPSAGAATAPGNAGVDGFRQFVSGARPKPGLMVLGLGTVGAIIIQKADEGLDRCQPIACMVGERQPVVVSATSPIKTLQDLFAAIRKDQGAVRWVGRALGGADHQIALLVTKAAGGDIRKVNYAAGDDRTEVATMLMKDEATVATGDLVDLTAQIRGGTLTALALSSGERAPLVDIPTFREQNVDIALIHWRGVVARVSMEPALAARFEDALTTLDRELGWRQLLEQLRWANLFSDADAFATRLKAERARMTALFIEAGALA